MEEGYLGLAFGDASAFQGTHKGWDVWPEAQSSKARILSRLPGKVIEVRDNGSVSGFTQCLQVRLANGVCLMIGHIKAGIARRWRVGDAFKVGTELCEVGTAADGKGVRHAHIEVFTDQVAALAYRHEFAKNPKDWRDDLNESGPVPRVEGFSGALAMGISEHIVRAGFSPVDIPCGPGEPLPENTAAFAEREQG